MDNYVIKIAREILKPVYSGLNSFEIMTIFHTIAPVVEEYTTVRQLTNNEVLTWASINGRAAKVEDAAVSHANPNVRSAAISFNIMLRKESSEVEISTEFRTMFSVLVVGSVLSQSDKDSFVALAKVTRTLAQYLDVRAKEGHIQEAMRYNAN